jgi:hypothetical protein
MTVFVEKAKPTERYSWIVYSGNQRISEHRKKKRALQEAEEVGRQRDAVVREQMQDGTWQTRRNY